MNSVLEDLTKFRTAAIFGTGFGSVALSQGRNFKAIFATELITYAIVESALEVRETI